LLGLNALETGRASPSTLKQLRQITEELNQEVHEMALELRPTALDDLGLVRTLENYIERWTSRSNVRVDLRCDGLLTTRLPGQIETTLYRIIQEALNNVLKHAHAKRVSLILDRRSDHVLVIIEDDGVGFDVEAVWAARGSERLGLIGMRERAALLKGALTVES